MITKCISSDSDSWFFVFGAENLISLSYSWPTFQPEEKTAARLESLQNVWGISLLPKSLVQLDLCH